MTEPDGVVIVGSLNADITIRTHALPAPGHTVHGFDLRTLPGGKGANQAVAAALLGGRVEMVGAVGEDANGAMLRQALVSAGVDDRRVTTAGTETGAAVITVDDHAENTIVLSAGANATLTELDGPAREAIAAASVLGLSLEIPLSTAEAAAAVARAAGTRVAVNLSPYRPMLTDLLALTDLLVVNEHEAEELRTDFSATDFAAALQAFGAPDAIVTRGAAGSTVFTEGRVVQVDAVPATAIDTTGCGDAYFGALLVLLAEGAPLPTASRFASAAAAISAEGVGAQTSYASRDQVSARLGR